MKYQEISWREMEGRICLFPIEKFRNAVKNLPGCEKAGYAAVYAYADHEKGMMLEVLGCAGKQDENFMFFPPDDHERVSVSLKEAGEEEFGFIDPQKAGLARLYRMKLLVLQERKEREEILRTRRMAFLDQSRDPYLIDTVYVTLFRDGCENERCPVLIEGLDGQALIGKLMKEPEQDFGYHAGEMIGFYAVETEEGEISCFCNMNPSRLLTYEQLKDGSMLRDAVAAFNQSFERDQFIEILELLRDSDVWIPCREAEPDQDVMIFHTPEGIMKTPETLPRGEQIFLPVFSDPQELDHDGNIFQKELLPFTQLLEMADKNPEIAGIVVNPFGLPFVLDRELFEIAAAMKSRITAQSVN